MGNALRDRGHFFQLNPRAEIRLVKLHPYTGKLDGDVALLLWQTTGK